MELQQLKDWTTPTLRRLVESDEALSKGPDSPQELSFQFRT